MLYPRKIQHKIDNWLLREEIIMLNGMRQVGKTSILKLLREDLKNKGITETQIFYLNLEDLETLNTLNQSPKNILNYIKKTDKKNFFLIDEIQYLDNPSNFLKYVYDEYREKIKLIITGSSSLELKAKLQDSLAGRKIVFEINPLTFEEFLQFKQTDVLKYYDKKQVPVEIRSFFKKYLDEYLLFGGMPKIVLTDDYDGKKILLSNYVSDYINKDVRYIGRIDNLLKFNQLVKVLANQIGSLLNIHELANTLNLKRREVEFFLFLLENTFVVSKIIPYYKNIRSQITKMPKIYFSDIGLRNQILNNFVALSNRADNGALFENFVYLELKTILGKENIYFYRTIHKTEIDFIFEKEGVVYPIEAKYQELARPAHSRVLSNFCNLKGINCLGAYLINLNLNLSDDKINFVTFTNLRKIISN